MFAGICQTRVSGRDYKAGHRTAHAGFLHLCDHLRKDSFRGRCTENDQKFLFNVSKIAENRETVEAADCTQDAQNKEHTGGINLSLADSD